MESAISRLIRIKPNEDFTYKPLVYFEEAEFRRKYLKLDLCGTIGKL